MRIVIQATDFDKSTADKALTACNNKTKTAMLMRLIVATAQEADLRLQANKGFLRQAVTSNAKYG